MLEVLQDLFDAVLVLDRFVEPELDLGHPAQAQPAADLAAEKRRGAIERTRRLLPRLLIAERGVEDARDLQVGCHLHARQRDEADARVVDLASAEDLADDVADLFADAIGTVRHKSQIPSSKSRAPTRL